MSDDLTPGSRLGSFEVVARLGRGGMGVVYEAKDSLGRHVAIKLLPQLLERDPEAIERFEREARRAAAVSHANVVRIHGVVASPSGRALVMELVRGQSLQQAIERRGRLPWREVAVLGAKLARALAAVHEKDLVHRDVKPANVLLGEDGEPKLADFGLARRVKTESVHLTRTGEVVGSFAFLPPEQANDAARADGRADLYGLGATLYAALTGKPPFDGEGVTLALKIMEEPAPGPRALAPDVPPALDELVRVLLAKKPGERPGALEVAAALEALARGERSSVKAVKTHAVRPWRWVVAAVLLLGTVAVVAVAGRALPARPTRETRRALEPVVDALDPEAPAVERALAAARAELGSAPGGAALAWRVDLVEAEVAWLRGDLARVESLAATLPLDARTRRLAALRAADLGPPEEALAALAPVASASELLARAFALVRAGREPEGLRVLEQARRAGGDRFHARAALVLAAAGRQHEAEAEPLGEAGADLEPLRAAIGAAHDVKGQSWASARSHVDALAAARSPWRETLVAPVLSVCRACADPGTETSFGADAPALEPLYERCTKAFELAETLSPGEPVPAELPRLATVYGLKVSRIDHARSFRAHLFALRHANAPDVADGASVGVAEEAGSVQPLLPVEEALEAFDLALAKTGHVERILWKKILFLASRNMVVEARNLAFDHPGLPLVDLYAAQFRLDAGELDEARAIYARLRISSEFYGYELWKYHSNYARLLAQPGASRDDLERALQEARLAVEADQETRRGGLAIEGDVLEKLGRLDEAANAWRSVYELGGRPALRRRIARILLAAGKREEALAELEKDPDSADLASRGRKGDDITDELVRTQGNAADDF